MLGTNAEKEECEGVLNAEGIICLVIRASEARARELISVPANSSYSLLVFK